MDRAASVERNFAPLWTLYSRERHGTASEDEVLWGLFRSRRESGGARSLSLFPLFSVSSSPEDGGRADLSLLLGAVRVRREGLRGHCRLLYFLRFGAADERQTTDPNAE
jgi:hypothetical protein